MLSPHSLIQYTLWGTYTYYVPEVRLGLDPREFNLRGDNRERY